MPTATTVLTAPVTRSVINLRALVGASRLRPDDITGSPFGRFEECIQQVVAV
jgi:hypothetical protein